MTDDKIISNTETSITNNGVDELVRIVNNHLNPVSSTSPTANSTTGSTRTYTSPLMGTSARAAKRRIDSDTGPVRIEGTDTYNQQLQHHYQNVRQILQDQQQPQNSNIDTSIDSRQSFSAKRDFFEQHFKTPSPAYDSPPRHQQGQSIITTTTSSITTPNVHDRTSSSSNESPSVDHVLEQAVELQKMSHMNSTKNDSNIPFIIERTEQYQVFLDSANHEIRRTPSIARTSIVQVTKTGYATDLDQAQAHVERLTDDHQAIQNLTRVLQEHNVTTINEYKRLPSQINSTPSSPTSDILLDRTNLSIKSDYSVIDALLNNPLGTNDEKYNQLLSIRSNDISTNLRNPEYLNLLKQPIKTSKKSNKKQPKEKKPNKKQPKEKKSNKKPPKEKKSSKNQPKEKKSKKTLTTSDTVEHAVITPLLNTRQSSPIQTRTPITTTTTTTISSEQTPLINPKEKKNQNKEKKKPIKTKSKQKSKNGNYQVIDAIINSPILLHLPDSYLIKYNVNAPSSQSSPLQSIPPSIPSNTIVTTTRPPTTTTTTTRPTTTTTTKPTTTITTTTTSKDKNVPVLNKNQTLYHLAKIVNDLHAHNAAALAASVKISTQSKEPLITNKQSESVVKEIAYQQRPLISSQQMETHPQSESIKPRVVYRYMDEQGRVLKISSTPPSQLREQPAQQYSYRNTEPPYFYGKHIATDDDRRHLLPQYEQRATWQGEPKLPTTVTREDFELRDKRVPQLIEQSIPTTRTVPVSVEHERSPRTSQQQQQRIYHYPNQQNIKLAWLPLSYPTDQLYLPSGAAGYDTDSTISERSATYRPYDYLPADHHYRYPNRPLHNDYYSRSPGPSYYPSPPPVPHGGRGISPEYGGVSRNYIEVFRGGDFRETKPSEIYSLPLSEHIRTSPISPSNSRHSRYDQYQSERYGTITNRNNTSTPLSQQNYYYSNSLPNSRYQQNIPPSTVYTSSHYTHRNPYSHRTVQSSPNREYTHYIRQSRSFDYRPLRTKLQREYKITPNLLVDEWDYSQGSDNIKYSTTSTTNQSVVSSPDDVFISSRTNKA